MNTFLALAESTRPVAFANTNSGSKVYISNAPVTVSLAKTDFEGLTYIEISNVGNMGEAGTSQNLLDYDVWGDEVTQKAKGRKNAGSPTLEVARDPDDAGQVALRAAAKTNLDYAIKIERTDVPDDNVASTPTIIYNAGVVTGPVRPFGRNEDFDLEVFTLGFNQEEVVVDPVAAP